jgi:hypothetical protein
LQNDTIIDVIHEALLRNWQRAHRWVEEETKSIETYLSLVSNARHSGGSLLQGVTLQMALNWWRTQRPSEAWAARYNDAQSFWRVVELIQASERGRKRRRAFIVLAILATVLLTMFSLFAFWRHELRSRGRVSSTLKISFARTKLVETLFLRSPMRELPLGRL